MSRVFWCCKIGLHDWLEGFWVPDGLLNYEPLPPPLSMIEHGCLHVRGCPHCGKAQTVGGWGNHEVISESSRKAVWRLIIKDNPSLVEVIDD